MLNLVLNTKGNSLLKHYIYKEGHPICQLISRHYGGKVITAKNREFGLATIKKKLNSKLIKNFFDNRKQRNVWMSHADHVTRLPKGFKAAASTKGSKFTIKDPLFLKNNQHCWQSPIYIYIHTYARSHFGSSFFGSRQVCVLSSFHNT